MRIIPNQSEKCFVSRLIKNSQKSICPNLINSETSIRMNPNQSETKFSIQINPNEFERGMIRIDSDWKFGLDQSDLGLDRINVWPFFIKRDTKRFSYWFGMIRTGTDTDIEMNRTISDWLGMNLNPILSPGKSQTITVILNNF